VHSTTATIGATVKKKFFIALFSGFFLFGALLATFGFTGTLFALPLGGMGDFYVEFDRLEGTGFKMSPHIGETGTEDQAPLVRNQIETATVEGLHIYKDLKLPTGNWIRINIQSDEPTTISGLIQDARFVEANLKFNEMAMQNHNTSNTQDALEVFKNNWGQNANSVTITDAKIVTDYLFQNLVTLNGAKITLDFIDDPDTIDGSTGSNASSDGSSNGGNTSNDQNSNGSSLPDTASNLFLPIFIGGVLILIGLIFLFIKMRKSFVEEKNTLS
jgi:hypothetical protein